MERSIKKLNCIKRFLCCAQNINNNKNEMILHSLHYGCLFVFVFWNMGVRLFYTKNTNCQQYCSWDVSRCSINNNEIVCGEPLCVQFKKCIQWNIPFTLDRCILDCTHNRMRFKRVTAMMTTPNRLLPTISFMISFNLYWVLFLFVDEHCAFMSANENEPHKTKQSIHRASSENWKVAASNK